MLKTKFRIADCFITYKDGGEVKKCAITEDGEKHIIQTMEDGTEYFQIDNPYHKNSLRERHFLGYLADAINAIRDDYADVLLGGNHTNVFTKHDRPIVLIDREKGEEYRVKSKDGWKDTEFGWGIEYGNKNSFGGYHLINEDGVVQLFGEYNPIVFDTEEEANLFFEEHFYNVAYEYAKEYVAVYGDKEKAKKVLDKAWGKECGIIFDLCADRITHTEDDKTARIVDDTRNLENIGWDIVQIIKPSKKDKEEV